MTTQGNYNEGCSDVIEAIRKKMSSKVDRWSQSQGECHNDVDLLLDAYDAALEKVRELEKENERLEAWIHKWRTEEMRYEKRNEELEAQNKELVDAADEVCAAWMDSKDVDGEISVLILALSKLKEHK